MVEKSEIRLCDYDTCTGCNACVQVCKHHAINKILINGFEYPEIDRDSCLQCGLCMSVCPILNEKNLKGNTHQNETKCLAAWNPDVKERMASSSGGAFSIMARSIIKEKGVVYGAGWDENLVLKHRSVESVEDLDIIRRSKYVQSDTGNTYNEVKGYLKQGKKVLYCGTPCQIAGLVSFLGGKDYSDLITVDVLCQGVPSQWSFSKYIKEVENKRNVKIHDCNFRSKEKGWRCGLLLLLLLLGRRGSPIKWYRQYLGNNEYYNAFFKELFMRDSCYHCQFKCDNQGYYSDITIADFWRIGNNVPFEIKDYEKGVSAVIVNTQKGETFFSKCSSNMNIVERTWSEFATNGGLRNSKKKSYNDEALQYLHTHSWHETQEKYFPVTNRDRIKVWMYFIFGERIIRKIFKRSI